MNGLFRIAAISWIVMLCSL